MRTAATSEVIQQPASPVHDAGDDQLVGNFLSSLTKRTYHAGYSDRSDRSAAGRSINPAIDIGQIEGGFVQGMGWLTTEQLVWNAKGYLSTHAPSTYKIPATGDIPAHFKVELWHEANREDNVFGSKAVGEPPFMLAISVYEALKDAVAQALGDGQAVSLITPATAENVLRSLKTIT